MRLVWGSLRLLCGSLGTLGSLLDKNYRYNHTHKPRVSIENLGFTLGIPYPLNGWSRTKLCSLSLMGQFELMSLILKGFSKHDFGPYKGTRAREPEGSTLENL